MSIPPEERSAAAARRPTTDPSRYLIPVEQLPAGFATRVGSGAAASVPRPAATVVLVRDSARGPEALLLRRPSAAAFAAGAWVFPGGRVDPEDADPRLARALSGRSAGWWGGRLGLSAADALGYLAAAVREAWEETGILLSEPQVSGERLRELRAELLAGRSLADLLERAGLRLDTRGMLYIAHWVTPEPERRRYDTRFFLARVPRGAECELIGEELAEARWVRPRDAVRAFRAGDLMLLPPTAHTLQRLAGPASLGALLDDLRGAPVPAILPRMRLVPDGVEIEIDHQP